MIDYCRLIENLVRISSNDTNQLNWYNISRTILHEQINQFNLNNKARQLHKNDIEDIANVLLNKVIKLQLLIDRRNASVLLLLLQCFSRISTTQHSQPPCPSCSNKELQMIKQWELSSFLLIGFSLILFCLILFLYTFHHHIFSRSYQYIG